MFHKLLLLALYTTFFIVYGQRTPEKLVIDGVVLGYTNDHTKTLFKKGKQIEVQGSIPEVLISIINSKNQVISSVRTNKGGGFRLVLDLEQEYELQYHKKGYGSSAF
ncbi:carboxypeptidase-like regulatory domain-containing protein [Crocinitomix sp.]|nr:carboxypeptidase-like regulatory domain-containing protein [Crocinitomix sp.]